MVPYRSTVLLFTCASCLGFLPSPARGLIHPTRIQASWVAPVLLTAAVNSLEVSQTSELKATELPDLGPEAQGPEVQKLQKTLKSLGYYEGVEDGVYGVSTAIAVTKFQQSVGLEADGVVGYTTWENLLLAVEKPKNSSVQTQPNLTSKISGLLKGKLKWVFLGLGAIALIALVGFLLNRIKHSGDKAENLQPNRFDRTGTSEGAKEGTREQNYDLNGSHDSDRSNSIDSKSPNSLAVGETTRLSKSHLIDELIKNLQQPDPAKRRQAIWELGRRGDSRAVQPLVNLMIDSDSKQRSLILAALSEIGTRTLTPMNRALAVSLQDENAEVRKNAIRDLTRIYELVTQMSQLLHHAVEDPDPEVQETARWALSQFSQIRLPQGMEHRPVWPKSTNPPEDSADK